MLDVLFGSTALNAIGSGLGKRRKRDEEEENG